MMKKYEKSYSALRTCPRQDGLMNIEKELISKTIKNINDQALYALTNKNRLDACNRDIPGVHIATCRFHRVLEEKKRNEES